MSAHEPETCSIDDDVVQTLAALAGMEDERIALRTWECVRPTLARELIATRRDQERSEEESRTDERLDPRTGLIVVGHTAIDRLIRYSGLFSDGGGSDDQRSYVYNSHSDEVVTRRGGIAANICYGATRLGLRPTLISAVGAGEGRRVLRELDAQGVDTSHVVMVAGGRTPRFSCVTDENFNQLAVFEDGSSHRQGDVDLDAVVSNLGRTDLVVITAGPISGMIKAKRTARRLRLDHLVDPAGPIRWSGLQGSELRELLTGSTYVVVTQRDLRRILDLTGWSHEELRSTVGVLVTTAGHRDVTIEGDDVETRRVHIAHTREHADPTGVSDAFRGGLAAALSIGLAVDVSVRVGCVLASCAFETTGTQEYDCTVDDLVKRLAESYGNEVADTVLGALPQPRRRGSPAESLEGSGVERGDDGAVDKQIPPRSRGDVAEHPAQRRA